MAGRFSSSFRMLSLFLLCILGHSLLPLPLWSLRSRLRCASPFMYSHRASHQARALRHLRLFRPLGEGARPARAGCGEGGASAVGARPRAGASAGLRHRALSTGDHIRTQTAADSFAAHPPQRGGDAAHHQRHHRLPHDLAAAAHRGKGEHRRKLHHVRNRREAKSKIPRRRRRVPRAAVDGERCELPLLWRAAGYRRSPSPHHDDTFVGRESRGARGVLQEAVAVARPHAALCHGAFEQITSCVAARGAEATHRSQCGEDAGGSGRGTPRLVGTALHFAGRRRTRGADPAGIRCL